MANKTITVSTEAYDALASLKKNKESFTELILRLFDRTKRGFPPRIHPEFLRPSRDLADAIEAGYRFRGKTAFREVEF